MTKKQNDDWYTEEDVNSKLSWNKLEEEFVNVRPIHPLPVWVSHETHSHRLVIAKG